MTRRVIVNLCLALAGTSAGAGEDPPRADWALARFSDRPLTAWLDDEQAWSVEHSRPNRTAGYHCFNVDQLVHPPQPDADPS